MESNDSILPTEPQTPSKLRGAHYAGDRPTREKLDQLYNKQKLSSGEIARQYSVTRQTVTNWLEMEGFDRRTGTEAAMLRFAAQAEFVPLAEREDCVLDRAWEARPERRIRDKVSCRLCFQQVSRLLGKTAHFSTCHEGMTGDEYARLMPRHRHDCFQHSADSNGLEVEKLMDDWCTEWATADEIRNWRRDPKLAQVDEYVGCLECGRKLFSGAEIQRHLRKIHNWSLA
jgi:DNA-binding transcriptional regulator YiaG